METPIRPKAINSGQAQYLRSIDRGIRKKWNQLYYKRKDKNSQYQSSCISIKKLNTQPIQTSPFQLKKDHHVIEFMKQNKKREHILDKNKRNEQIFYRKRQSCPHTLKKQATSISNQRLNQISSASIKQNNRLAKEVREKIMLPLMLQKRKQKLQKQMLIIKYVSQKSLSKIDLDKSLKKMTNLQKRERLMDNLKGSKLYYRFVQQWSMPRYQQSK